MPIFTPKNLAQGQLGAAAAGDLYTVPAATNAIVSLITLVNTDTVVRLVNLYIKTVAGVARRIIPVNNSMGAGALVETPSNKTAYTLGPGDKLQGDADVAAKIDFTVSGVEQT